MNTANPTPLRIGLVGTLLQKRYRVAGRVVMGMEEAGQTYFWNEFHLVNMESESETLVYEETEIGGEWRLFTLFEPRNPMTVGKAVTVQIGNQIDVDGTRYRVSLVDESKVYHIEGEAPEGVEVGDVAHHFNAEAGQRKIVVSWTGEEIEYYSGQDTTASMVMQAFNLRTFPRFVPHCYQRQSSTGQWMAKLKPVAAVLAGLLLLLFAFRNCDSTPSTKPTKIRQAPTSPLKVGSSGHVNGRTYQVQRHEIMEIAEVGLRYQQHEYHLLDSEGGSALLIFGGKSDKDNWVFFQPAETEFFSPAQAAAKKIGDFVTIGNDAEPVKQLFKATVRKSESLEQMNTNAIFYGLLGASASRQLLARWNENGIACYHGKLISGKEVTAAFGRKP